MSERARVVACMPTWNGEAFLDETLASLAAQTYGNLHVLISDDASTDRTHEICQAYADADARFRVVRQPARRGWIGNVNALLHAAQGEYALVASHDDPLEPAYVARMVEALESRPSAVVAFTDLRVLDQVLTYAELEGVTDRVERARRIVLRRGHWWLPYRGLFRLSAARRIGGLRPHLAGEYQADYPWLVRLALLGEFVRVPEPLIRKVYREEGVTAGWMRSRGARDAAAVLLACAQEVRRAGLPIREQLPLYATFCRFGLWALRERHVF